MAKAVVIDNGSFLLKAGISGDSAPKAAIRTSSLVIRHLHFDQFKQNIIFIFVVCLETNESNDRIRGFIHNTYQLDSPQYCIGEMGQVGGKGKKEMLSD